MGKKRREKEAGKERMKKNNDIGRRGIKEKEGEQKKKERERQRRRKE